MWLERRGDSEKYGPGDVSVMKPWSFPKLFKFLKSWLRAVCSPLCNYIASSLPNFPSPLINYVMHSLFFILLFLNNNKKHWGRVWILQLPEHCSRPLDVMMDTEFNCHDSDDIWQAALERPLGYAWHRTCFSEPKGSTSFCYLTFWKKCPVVATESDWN